MKGEVYESRQATNKLLLPKKNQNKPIISGKVCSNLWQSLLCTVQSSWRSQIWISANGMGIFGTLLSPPLPPPSMCWQGDFSEIPWCSGTYTNLHFDAIALCEADMLSAHCGGNKQKWRNAIFPGSLIRGTGQITLPPRWLQINVIKFYLGSTWRGKLTVAPPGLPKIACKNSEIYDNASCEFTWTYIYKVIIPA
jgi:hypothetical protein